MALQEEGWPLGLRLLNARIGLVRNGDFSGSISFSTVLTASPTPSTDDSSSVLDTESTGSFFRDKSITLGRLIGISSFLELSRRSTRGRMVEPSKDNKKNHKLRPWLFSLCSKLTTDAVSVNDAPSLGHYLVAERRAATTIYGPNDFSPVHTSNSLFVGGQVAQSSTSLREDGRREPNRSLDQNTGYGAPIIFGSLCR
ncbi:uncharacterized protein At3g17950-like [Abrus precatorius]|uniref:Uncharacterized protein At3g17950-like n=1 Tax=Abrus precatorius TaxID=3816 RepID=A0A8B8K022_ABRPR|nr:uncharacterized protein At3g17950-like [Abrus precatorius]